MGPTNAFIDSEIKGKFVLGYTAAFGCNFSLGSRLAIFGEIGAVSQRLKGTSGELTRFEIDGVDQLPTTQPVDKQWIYLESINSNSNSPALNPNFNPEIPEERVQISQNFSSYFIKGGVTVFVGGIGADD